MFLRRLLNTLLMVVCCLIWTRSSFGQCTNYVPDRSAFPFQFTIQQSGAVNYTDLASGASGTVPLNVTYQFPVPDPYDWVSFIGLNSANVFQSCGGSFVSASASTSTPATQTDFHSYVYTATAGGGRLTVTAVGNAPQAPANPTGTYTSFTATNSFTLTYNIVSGAYSMSYTGNVQFTSYDSTNSYSGGYSESGSASGIWPVISTALVITTSSLPNATAGSPYSAALAATGGTPPYAWSVVGGFLPTGLSLNQSGVITGTVSFLLPFPEEMVVKVADQFGDTNQKSLFLGVMSGAKPALSNADKEACIEHSSNDAKFAVIFQVLAVAAALDPATLPLVPFFEFLAEEFSLDASRWLALSLDAPDNNFRSISPAVIPRLPILTISGGTKVNGPEIKALNSLMVSVSERIAYEGALLTAMNRAQGALAANDSYWEARQLHAAALYASLLAQLLNDQQKQTANLQAALNLAAFPTTLVSQNMLDTFQSSVATNGLPASFARGLLQLGADNSTVKEIQSFLSFPNAESVSFPDFLTDPTFIVSSKTLGQALANFSATSAAGAYQFGGFVSPQVGREFESGDKVLVSFQLKSASGSPVVGAAAILQTFLVDADGTLLPVAVAPNGGLFSSNEENTYKFLLNTNGLVPGTYTLRTTLDDLTSHEVEIVIRADD